jgi:hypothetical protein
MVGNCAARQRALLVLGQRLHLGGGLRGHRSCGARRGSPDPAGLPDRQVSRAHRRPRFQRCSCLLSLLQTKETDRSSIWAGSGDPRPARVLWAGSGVATVTGFAGESGYGQCTHGPYPNTGDPRLARVSYQPDALARVPTNPMTPPRPQPTRRATEGAHLSGLMDQGGGIERVAGPFVCHVTRREPAQLVNVLHAQASPAESDSGCAWRAGHCRR